MTGEWLPQKILGEKDEDLKQGIGKGEQEQSKDRQGEAEEKESLEWGKDEEIHAWVGWTDGQADR